jgi:hypothetical protein
LFSCSRFLFQNFSSVDLFCLLVRPLHFSFEARCPCRVPAAAASFSRLCASAGSVSAAHCIRSHAVKDFTVSSSAPAIFAANRIFLFCATLVRSSVTRGWNLSARLLSVSVFHFSRPRELFCSSARVGALPSAGLAQSFRSSVQRRAHDYLLQVPICGMVTGEAPVLLLSCWIEKLEVL